MYPSLWQHRHELFADALQQDLLTLYKDQPRGQPPIPPAQLALVAILHAYMQVSDDQVLEATTMDHGWHMVLDCLDCETPPFSTETLVAFRQRLIAQHMDHRLLERTMELAATSGAFGPQQLRAALDSSPLWGAGRLEDTYNLFGRAQRRALRVIARQQGRGLRVVAEEAGASLRAGSSVKAGLDPGWDDPSAQQQALAMILDALSAVEHWLKTYPVLAKTASEVAAIMTVGQQVRAQDVVTTPDRTPTLRHGVAAERRMSTEDAEICHGWKSRSRLVDGYKRHVLRDLDSCLIVAVGVTPANAPEARVTDAIATDVATQQRTLRGWHIGRAYLARQWVQQRTETLAMFCKAWPVRQGFYVPQRTFQLDWERYACGVQAERMCPLHPVARSRSQRRRASTVRCGSAAPQACRAAVSVCIPMKPDCRRGGNDSRRRRVGCNCGSVR